MKGNWPTSLKLPGWIHFSYEAQVLPEFHYSSTATPDVQLSQYQAIIAEKVINFAKVKLPAEFGPVDLNSVVENGISSTDNWPQIDYTEFTDFSSTDASGKPVWVQVKGQTLQLITNPNDMTVIEVTSNTSKSTSLVTLPGKETAQDLSELYNLLKSLTARVTPGDNTMKDQVKPFSDFLGLVVQVRISQDSRIKELCKQHNDLVQNGSDADVLAISRTKLESAKRAAVAIVESYNATVLSYPD